MGFTGKSGERRNQGKKRTLFPLFLALSCLRWEKLVCSKASGKWDAVGRRDVMDHHVGGGCILDWNGPERGGSRLLLRESFYKYEETVLFCEF
jgi:hypothetical protein